MKLCTRLVYSYAQTCLKAICVEGNPGLSTGEGCTCISLHVLSSHQQIRNHADISYILSAEASCA